MFCSLKHTWSPVARDTGDLKETHLTRLSLLSATNCDSTVHILEQMIKKSYPIDDHFYLFRVFVLFLAGRPKACQHVFHLQARPSKYHKFVPRTVVVRNKLTAELVGSGGCPNPPKPSTTHLIGVYNMFYCNN